MFAPEIVEKAIAHAKAAWPQESVGVIAGGDYHPLQNIHPAPQEGFLTAPEDYVRVEMEIGPIEAVVHSHPHKGESCPRLYPSAADMQGQLDSAVPWGIISCDAGRAWPVQWFGDQCPIPPYEGRTYIHGIQDCYSLIRDYYRLDLGVILKEFPRDWQWWESGNEDLYSLGFAKTGFKVIPLSQARPGDVFLAKLGRAALRNNITNHGGIYLGNEEILHHKCGLSPYDPQRLSVKEGITRYAEYITHMLRHEALP